jgi:CRP-like cAMP-binding protein
MPLRPELVRPFRDDPDLLRGVPAAEAAALRDRVVTEAMTLPPGRLAPLPPDAEPGDLGFLILCGTIVRRTEVFGRRAVELLGQGDIVRTWRAIESASTLPCEPSWTVLAETRVARLDESVVREAAVFPTVLSEITRRFARRPSALTTQLAIAQLPRLDTRLLLLLWRLADRWGRVGPEGVVLPLRLSQETLGELVAARRASVNAALRELRVQGLVQNPSPGRWLLLGAPPSEWDGDPAAEDRQARLAGV